MFSKKNHPWQFVFILPLIFNKWPYSYIFEEKYIMLLLVIREKNSGKNKHSKIQFKKLPPWRPPLYSRFTKVNSVEMSLMSIFWFSIFAFQQSKPLSLTPTKVTSTVQRVTLTLHGTGAWILPSKPPKNKAFNISIYMYVIYI